MGVLGFLKTICDHNFSLDIKTLIVYFLSYIKSWPQSRPHQLYLFGTFHNMEDDEKIVDSDHNNNVIHKQQHMGRGKEGMLLYDIYLQ